MSDTTDYAADVPVSDPQLDAFRRLPFARRIARTIASRRDSSSVVVGIYGAWGEGKTSVLNFIEWELGKSDNIIPVAFDPWRFGDEAQLLQSFFSTLAHALGRSLKTRRETIGTLLSDYASPIIPSVGVGPLKIDDRRKQIEKILEEEKKRVVVLMDDIDRLDRSEIQAIFKLVKLSANFANTAYILAFDEDIVAASLGEKYAEGTKDAGYDFLEKIVQVPLHLPAVDRDLLRRFCFDAVSQILQEADIDLTEEQVYELANRFDHGLLVRLRTPRDARRFANALAFSLPMLKGEAHPVDLMLVEGIRVFYPGLYDAMRANPDAFLRDGYVFTGLEDREKVHSLEIVKGGFAGLTSDEEQAAQSLITDLFPRLSELFSNHHYGREWTARWAAEQRVAARSYFTRFFGYAIPEGDVSDREMSAFLASLETESVAAIADAIRVLVDNGSPDILISKLFAAMSTLTETSAHHLALALVRVGDVFPDMTPKLGLHSPFATAALGVQRLLYSINDDTTRVEVATALIQDGQPVPFVAESILREGDARRARNRENDRAIDQGLLKIPSYLETPGMRTAVATRMWAFAHEHAPLFVHYPTDTPRVLLAWELHDMAGGTNAYLEEIFDREPSSVLRFLTCYLTPVQDLTTGRMGHNDFDQHAYDAVRSVVDPRIVRNALERFVDFAVARQRPTWGATPDERTADAFEHIDSARVNAQVAGANDTDGADGAFGLSEAISHEGGVDVDPRS